MEYDHRDLIPPWGHRLLHGEAEKPTMPVWLDRYGGALPSRQTGLVGKDNGRQATPQPVRNGSNQAVLLSLTRHMTTGGRHKKCSTPHVTQDELEKAFVSVMQKVIAEKDAIFAVCRDVLDEVLDTSELDRIATRLQDQALGMAERVRKLVEENARVRRDQEEYQREYDVLAAEHEKLSRQMQEVEVWKKDKIDRRRRIEVFLHMLEEQEECVRFDPYTFVALVGKVVVGQNRKLEFVFRNGMNFCWLMQ